MLAAVQLLGNLWQSLASSQGKPAVGPGEAAASASPAVEAGTGPAAPTEAVGAGEGEEPVEDWDDDEEMGDGDGEEARAFKLVRGKLQAKGYRLLRKRGAGHKDGSVLKDAIKK